MHPLRALPMYVGDGSVTNLIVGNGQEHMIKRAWIDSRSKTTAWSNLQMSWLRELSRAVTSNWSLAYRRQAMNMIVQKRVGDISKHWSGSFFLRIGRYGWKHCRYLKLWGSPLIASRQGRESYLSKYQSISWPDINWPLIIRGFVASVLSSNGADGTKGWGCWGGWRWFEDVKVAPLVVEGVRSICIGNTALFVWEIGVELALLFGCTASLMDLSSCSRSSSLLSILSAYVTRMNLWMW